MSITSTIDKTAKDIRKTLEDRTPLLALTGLGDAAVKMLRETGADVQARVEKFDAKEIPAKAQALVGETVATAVSTYGDLADRGQTLIARVRGQQATADLQDQASATVAKVKAASTTAKKSATKTASSAKGTRTTAKKTAKKTTTATKAAATSAKKTASAAKKATTAAADKVGN